MRLSLVALFFTALSAAPAQVSGPQLGWIPDGSHIRPVSGIPQAAAVGARVPSDQDFSQIAPSPDRNYVLVSAAQSGVVSIYSAESGIIPLNGAGNAPDLVTLSPRGFAAALWFASMSQVQIITGLPDAPVIRQVHAPLLGVAPDQLAITDDGEWIAGIWSSGTYAFGPNGETIRLPIADGVTALAFLEATHDLAAAGPAGLNLVSGIDGALFITNLLASSGSLQPAGLGVAGKNQALIMADKNGTVTMLNLASKSVTRSDCTCQPEGLFPLAGAAFRLTSLNHGAFKLFDASTGQVLFAPVALPHQAQRGEGARR
jgi:hypothetical protein